VKTAAHHARLRAGARHHRARRPARRPSRPSAPPCSPTRAAPASASGRPARRRQRRTNTIVNELQPQLPQAQRRLGQHARLRDLARHRRRTGPGRHLDFDPINRHAHQRRRRRAGEAHGARSARSCRRQGFDPGENTFTAPPADGSASRSRSPPPPTASSCSSRSSRGTATTTSAADADEGPGQVHHRPHLDGRPWLKYRGHLENISGNLFLGAVNAFTDADVGEGKDQLDGDDQVLPRHRQALPRGRRALGRHRRRELRRGRRASTPPWSPASAAPR
jgi:hypothetical protein